MWCEGEDHKEAGDCGSRMFQVWEERAQVQRVSSLERRKEVASGRRDGACGHTTKGIVKGVEEKSSACPMMEGAGAL